MARAAGQSVEHVREAPPPVAFAESLSRILGPAYRVALYTADPPRLVRSWGRPRRAGRDPVPGLLRSASGPVINEPVEGRRRISVLEVPGGAHAVAIEVDAVAFGRAARLLAWLADPDADDGAPATDHVGETLDRLVGVAEEHIGVPVGEMSRRQKQEVVRFLDERGAFLIKKAVEDVAGRLGVSRFTIYNYLDQANRPG